jgi:hypothetical protein
MTTTQAPPAATIHRDDIVIDPNGARYRISTWLPDDDAEDGYFILRPEGEDPWANPQTVRYVTFAEFDTQQWTHLPREEVRMMDDQPTKRGGEGRHVPPTPPRMTKANWQRRDRTAVTLSRGELEQLGQLIRAGHAQLNDGRPVSPQLRAAMTRIGIATHGL